MIRIWIFNWKDFLQSYLHWFTYATHRMWVMHKTKKTIRIKYHVPFSGKSIYTGSFETNTTPSLNSRLAFRFWVGKNSEKVWTFDWSPWRIQNKFTVWQKPLYRAVSGKNCRSILKLLSLIRTCLPESYGLTRESTVDLSSNRLEPFVLSTASSFSAISLNTILPKELKNILISKPVVKEKAFAKNLTSSLYLY